MITHTTQKADVIGYVPVLIYVQASTLYLDNTAAEMAVCLELKIIFYKCQVSYTVKISMLSYL